MRSLVIPVLAVLAACSSPQTRPAPAAAEIKVDHITLCGPDLQQMRDTFADAGVITEYGGKHANGITEMALSAFPDGSYFELIAPLPEVDATPHYWADFMMGNAGPCGWAITTTDLESDAARFKAAGVSINRDKGGRQRPDGTQLRWETATVGPPPQGSFFPFLIQDETGRNLRAYPQGAPTTTSIMGVHSVVVAVRDLPSAIGQYRRAFGFPEPELQNEPKLGAQVARFLGSPIVLATPSGSDTWIAQRLARFGEIPCAFLLASPNPFAGSLSTWFGQEVTWLNTGDSLLGVVAP